MIKFIIIFFIVTGAAFWLYRQAVPLPVPAEINVVSTVTDDRDQAFEASQAVSTDNTLPALIEDLGSTVIRDEDLSDLE